MTLPPQTAYSAIARCQAIYAAYVDTLQRCATRLRFASAALLLLLPPPLLRCCRYFDAEAPLRVLPLTPRDYATLRRRRRYYFCHDDAFADTTLMPSLRAFSAVDIYTPACRYASC